MAIIPNLDHANLTASSVGILNGIRELASPQYQAGVPEAQNTLESIRQVGASILGFQSHTNEFLHTLVNRIAFEVIASRSYTNPWSFMKRGYFEMGDTIEEIYIHLIEPIVYRLKNDGEEMSEVLRMYKPKVSTAFHTLNYKMMYPVSITEQNLRQAFTTYSGVTTLVTGIINSIYTSVEYDEYLVEKYALCRICCDGTLPSTQIQSGSTPEEQSKNLTRQVIGYSDDFTFMKKYNIAGVPNTSQKMNQYLFVTPWTKASLNVDVLAVAFNMEKAEFMGHMVLIDSFTDFDYDRLDKLFAEDETYAHFTATEISKLETVQAIHADRDFFFMYDNLAQMRSNSIGSQLVDQYFYHVWKTFSFSPFHNVLVYTTGATTITAVAYDETSITGNVGDDITINATGFTSVGVAQATGTWYKSTASGFTSPTPVSLEDYDKIAMVNGTLEFTAKSAGTTYFCFVPDSIVDQGASEITTFAAKGTNKVTVTISA